MWNHFIKALWGGVAISIGGTVYLSVENHVAGAVLFSLGLFTIYTFQFNLFTGKVCYIPNRKPAYVLEVLMVYAGNIAGTLLTGSVFRATKLIRLAQKAEEMSLAKLSDGYGSTFVMAVLCGILMCIAVVGFLTITDSVGKHFALVAPIAVFILSGFEHSIANLYYFTLAGVWGGAAVINSAVVALGNAVGGALIPLTMRLLDGREL